MVEEREGEWRTLVLALTEPVEVEMLGQANLSLTDLDSTVRRQLSQCLQIMCVASVPLVNPLENLCNPKSHSHEKIANNLS